MLGAVVVRGNLVRDVDVTRPLIVTPHNNLGIISVEMVSRMDLGKFVLTYIKMVF